MGIAEIIGCILVGFLVLQYLLVIIRFLTGEFRSKVELLANTIPFSFFLVVVMYIKQRWDELE